MRTQIEICPQCETTVKSINHDCQKCGTTTIPPVKKGDNITIVGRRWFDRINGNTYFSAVALINGKQVAEIPFEYGYGNQYEHSMFNLLFKLGYCADRESYSNGSNEAFWNYCSRKGITKYVTHSDVNRKKDL